ncbi:MAG: AAA family ATPase [Bacteroidales bacterium]|nr:AAA family ATPase [Bacteroidales bacterium]
MHNLIGRQYEVEELERIYRSGRPEFVVIYGRRRVGKTFLVTQALKGRISFHHTGIFPEEGEKNPKQIQLESFYFSLLSHGMEGIQKPKSWMEAFYYLEQLLIQKDNGSRQVVFLDELPWMDTPKSGFLSAFEGFWNGWCSDHDNIMLVVCGSATSWILDNISHNEGGLYGRSTQEIKLSPFTLGNCEEYFEHEGIELSRYDIVQTYMVFGGIPYYLRQFRKGLSFEGNTDSILFGPRPKLNDEFNKLFRAIFRNSEDCKKIIRFLATRHSGFTREDISKATGIPYGGGLSDTLSALAESDFILRYTPYGEKGAVERYKLIDNFCLFWIKYVEPQKEDESFMSDSITSDIMRSWRGIAFEEVCWQHIPQIKRALGIDGVKTKTSAWNVKGDDNNDGAQIDLLISRADNIVNLCEMKFSGDSYVIDKEENLRIRKRLDSIGKTLSPKQRTHFTMVTTYGVAYGKYSGIVQKQVIMDQLFSHSF